MNERSGDRNTPIIKLKNRNLFQIQKALLFALAAIPIFSSCGNNVPSQGNHTSDTGVSDAGSDGGDGGDSGMPTAWECLTTTGQTVDYLQSLGCAKDFDAVAALPSDSSLTGARSVKTVIDRLDNNALYFQNSALYPVHYDFASAHLSGVRGLPLVTDTQSFNDNYYDIQRRFLLGAVTYYTGPEKWVFEISPYDNATPEMITEAFLAIKGASYFGDRLFFHPAGEKPEGAASALTDEVPVITTKVLYEGIDYQALNLGESCGRLVFITAEELETQYVTYEDIVVLDRVPNDISVVQGIITSEFQTPLSHVNVLSQNRGTPNMALTDAFEHQALRALEGQWVKLNVGAFEYKIDPITKEVADTCQVRPQPLGTPNIDLTVTDLRNIEDIYGPSAKESLTKEQIDAAIPAFGGKASHYGGLAWIEEAHAPKAFVIPIYYYDLFMKENRFDERVSELLSDPTFDADPQKRDEMLEALREEMYAGQINETFMSTLFDKLNTEYPNTRMRFRSSTNAEDLGDFTGAGLYTSRSADPNDADFPVADALRTVWASIWYFRAFEERHYRGIDHQKVGMAILVHHSFPDEEANGVALTANPYDTMGLEPSFYVNVQVGEVSIVQPPPETTSDQFVYYYLMREPTVVFIEHSSLVADGTSVLTTSQIHELGKGLEAIHNYFFKAYGTYNADEWYAMDVEFKFDGDPGETPTLAIKQARPHPGR